jgi:tetratricopeptide (TPR) repeat protein
MSGQVKPSALGIIGGAFGVIADLITIVDFFTSTMEPEVSKIYDYTHDTRENLKKVMKKLGVVYEHEKPKEFQNNWEKTTESFKRTNDSLDEARILNSEMAIAVSEETNEMIGKSLESTGDTIKELGKPFVEDNMRDSDMSVRVVNKTWEEYKSARDLVREAKAFNIEGIAAMNKSINSKAKELYEKTIEIYKKYPQTFKIPMVEESTTPKDGGQAKADMEKVSVKLTKETDTTLPTITEADADLIADKVIAKLNDEKAIESAEKATDMVSNEEVDNMTTLYNNLNEVSGNLITAVEVLQKNVDPAAGNENILPISLSEEDKIFISTQIAEKLNEEEEIVPAENAVEGVTNEELGVEVRDSKRSLKGEISDLKSKIDFLIKLIGKKAMTFDDIYNMLARRMAHDHEMKTGRKIIY